MNPENTPSVGLDKTDAVHAAFEDKKERVVTLRLISREQDADCSFWVGLTQKSQVDPGGLMAMSEIPEIFYEAATKGVAIDDRILLTNTNVSPPRFIYLTGLPEPDFRSRANWIDGIVKNIGNMNPSSLGLHLSPLVIDTPTANELACQLLVQLVISSHVDSYYLLVGEHGLNPVLNSVLKLREDFEQEDINFFIFH